MRLIGFDYSSNIVWSEEAGLFFKYQVVLILLELNWTRLFF